MGKLTFIASCLAASFTTIVQAATPTKLNVVLILADDLGWTDIAPFGSDLHETPALDQLARDGMKFTQNYSACTVCSPTRAALMTGKYPARLHITDGVVRLACERITGAEIDELERNVEASFEASEKGNYPERSRINLEFHNVLARATRNPVFVAVMSGLISVMQHFVDTLGPPRGKAVYASRRRFIAHLRAREPDAAIAELKEFLRGVHKQYLSRLEKDAAKVARTPLRASK